MASRMTQRYGRRGSSHRAHDVRDVHYAAYLGRDVRVYKNPLASGGPRTPKGAAASRTAGTSWAVVKVIFPNHYVLEARFGRTETVQRLMDLLRRVISRPEVPFYVYTAPPKERIVDMSADWPLAEGRGPFLREEVCSLEGLGVVDAEVLTFRSWRF